MRPGPGHIHIARWHVRQYELDSFGHVNNAVYLNYVEQIAVEHSESLGVGRVWCEANGGAWIVRRHEITYRLPAMAGDEIEMKTEVLGFRAATGTRRTTISRVKDGAALVECTTEWVWLKMPEGRPSRVPRLIVEKMNPPSASAVV